MKLRWEVTVAAEITSVGTGFILYLILLGEILLSPNTAYLAICTT